MELKITTWNGCYRRRWRQAIVPDAFTHPAKFSPGLIERIYAHGMDVGWWKKGDLIGDPFAGVGCGGIAAAETGLRWVGVELEPCFEDLARQNFEHHRRMWEATGKSMPEIRRGDARRFSEVLGAAAGIVTSPPYVDSESTRAGGPRTSHPDGRSGDVEGIVTSPPYSEGIGHRLGKGGPATKAHAKREELQRRYTETMTSEGNIADLPTGRPVDGIVTSPPWERETTGHDKKFDATKQSRARGGPCAKEYGETVGQIGNNQGETYWQAMADVYAECWKVLRPGRVLVVVVKDYVKNKARVPLCDQTLALLERVGFEVSKRIRAMLVDEKVEAGLFGPIKTVVERKSFFRRLAEKKGAPRIDWEEVLVLRKARRQGGAKP